MRRTQKFSPRPSNTAAVLRALREHGPMQRAELVRQTGLARATVMAVVEQLVALGTLRSAKPAASPIAIRSPGRPAEVLVLDPDAGRVVGLAFTYHEVRAVVANYAHTVLAELAEPLPLEQNWQSDLEIGVELVRRVLSASHTDPSQVLGVGLGVPGPVDGRSGVSSASSSNTWLGAVPAEEFANQLALPVVLDNSARLSLLAEARWGVASGCHDVVYLKLSSGVGGGLLTDGVLLRGRAGAAGELGHACVEPGGRVCRCGRRGCLEAYASIPAVLETAHQSLGYQVELDDLLELAKSGDRIVERILAEVGQLVGTAAADLVNLLNPELLVVAGELARAKDILLPAIAGAISAQSLRLPRECVEVVKARYGPEAAAIGGVALVLREEEHLVMPVEEAA